MPVVRRQSFMTPDELLSIRMDLKFKPIHMYRALGIPRRTYQDYESGRRGIPKDFATRVHEMFPEIKVTTDLPEQVDAKTKGGAVMVEKREQITMDKADADNLRLRAENAELRLQILTGQVTPNHKDSNPGEDDRIIYFVGQGLSHADIGEKVGRSKDGVRSIVIRLKKEGRL